MSPSPPSSPLSALTISPPSLPHLLLRESISSLTNALSTKPSGLLLLHRDPYTLHQLLTLTLPHLILHPSTDPDLPPSPQTPSSPLCFTHLDAPCESILPFLKAIFTRRTAISENPFPVLATASHLHNVPAALLRAGRFEKILHLTSPSLEARQRAWRCVFEHWRLLDTAVEWTEADITELAMISPGYSIQDFARVIGRVEMSVAGGGGAVARMMQLVKESRVSVGGGLEFVEEGVPGFGEARGGWEEVGGYHEVKRVLERLVEWPVRHRRTFDRLGVGVSRGVLLHGPGGCGKSMLVMGFLGRLRHANWMRVCGGDLFSKWFGESEARVRRVFERARQLTPCVVFLDELDVVGGLWRGEEESGGVERRVLGALLTEMDGIEGGGVFVVACANGLGGIDPALLRPGRLDHLVEMSLPTLVERADILGRMLRGVQLGADKDAVIQTVANATHDMSGAELKAVCTEAGMLAIEQRDEPDHVSVANMMDAIATVRLGSSKGAETQAA